MTAKIKTVHIFGGGTIAHISNHFAVSAPAYGNTASELAHICRYNADNVFVNCKIRSHITKMASMGEGDLETNEDVAARIEELKKDPNTKVIFFNCALVDFVPHAIVHKRPGQNYTSVGTEFGKYAPRLESRNGDVTIGFKPADKIIGNIRKGRKDIFLVGFKTTCGASKQEMFEKGLRLCKEGSVNLVLVNDTKTRWNMIVTPEEVTYHETDNRLEVLKNLVEMTWLRSQLTFTQSTVVAGDRVPWTDPRVPASLREVVDHCVGGSAYKVFNGATVGHFACKLSDTEFLTSIRKSNFNKLYENGLVYVKTDGPDTVLAYGAKPSVGGQSQRIVFREHPGMDCIVHFHCPLRPGNVNGIPIRSQREVECGSHQCGKNTSDGLGTFLIWDGPKSYQIKAVMLDQHGPNIVFNKDTPAKAIIDFIEHNFDLTKKTGGYNL